MSIGVGFHCTDGIVLCADTQITWPANHKYYESKIYAHTVKGAGILGFTYAGNPNLMKMFYGKFQAAMQLAPSPHTASQMQDVIETVLDLMDIIDSDPDGLQMLCGIVIPAIEMRLLKSDRKALSEVSTFDYVGVGDSSLLRYLAPLLARGRLHTMDQALNTSVYLVHQAKKYVDGCGGDTHAIALMASGSGVRLMDAAFRLEPRLAGLEHLLGYVAQSFFDSRDSDEDFENTMKRLAGALRIERPSLVRLGLPESEKKQTK